MPDRNDLEDFSNPIKAPQLKKAQQIYILWVGPDFGPLLDQEILRQQWFKHTAEINSLQQTTLRWNILFFFFFFDEENGAQRNLAEASHSFRTARASDTSPHHETF